eukprot:GEMP01050770.1.p1 GENE.GEMP01050770.1~~GEMP01050770.1.p1  ORF type:complete len:166 (+),score=52.51 GEMP01050770.1:332-829(+)
MSSLSDRILEAQRSAINNGDIVPQRQQVGWSPPESNPNPDQSQTSQQSQQQQQQQQLQEQHQQHQQQQQLQEQEQQHHQQQRQQLEQQQQHQQQQPQELPLQETGAAETDDAVSNAIQTNNNQPLNSVDDELPDGWQKLFTEDGKEYYYTSRLPRSQWERPPPFC